MLILIYETSQGQCLSLPRSCNKAFGYARDQTRGNLQRTATNQLPLPLVHPGSLTESGTPGARLFVRLSQRPPSVRSLYAPTHTLQSLKGYWQRCWVLTPNTAHVCHASSGPCVPWSWRSGWACWRLLPAVVLR